MSASLATLKPLTVCITTNCGEILKELRIPDHLTCHLRNLHAGQKATLHGTMDWFKIRKRVRQGCHSAYLNYMQSTSSKILGWMNYKLESRSQKNINNLRYADDTTLTAESEEELKSLLMKVKEESEKAGLKQHSKNEDHGIQSHYFMANRCGNSG